MKDTAQSRAIKAYRKRLVARGMARFEVVAPEKDRDLIRTLARRLAEGGPDAARLRTAVSGDAGDTPPRKGGIVRALLASPLVGSELDLTRPREEGREVDI